MNADPYDWLAIVSEYINVNDMDNVFATISDYCENYLTHNNSYKKVYFSTDVIRHTFEKLFVSSNLECASKIASRVFISQPFTFYYEDQITPYIIRIEFRRPGISVFVSKDALQSAYHYVFMRLPSILNILDFIANYIRRSGSVFINLADAAREDEVSFCSSRVGANLMPDTEFLVTCGYQGFRNHLLGQDMSWAQRKPVAIWRGSTTGIRRPDWRSLPRIALCMLGQNNRDMLDCAITSVVQSNETNEYAQISEAGLIDQPISPFDYQLYKFQIDIDGNSNAWSGLFTKLLTGSLVLKVISPFNYSQWFYDRLIPWYNYLPIESDLSDLTEKIRWAQQNDERARLIGEAGARLALSMTIENESEWTLAKFEDIVC